MELANRPHAIFLNKMDLLTDEIDRQTMKDAMRTVAGPDVYIVEGSLVTTGANDPKLHEIVNILREMVEKECLSPP